MRRSTPRSKSTSEAVLQTSVMMATDGVAILLALCLASMFRFDLSPTMWLQGRIWLLDGRTFPLNAGYLLFYFVALLVINRRVGRYGPPRVQGALHELRETIQGCLGAGLLLCGGLYLLRDATVSREFLICFIILSTVFLCTLRGFWRWSLYRRYARGIDTRNVLVVGTSHMGNAVRRQIDASGHFGRVFKGFIELDGQVAPDAERLVLGDLKQLIPIARQYFIDEIIIAQPCPTAKVIELVELGMELDIEVLVIPGFYDELTPDAPVEYMGTLPVVTLHRRDGKLLANLLKRFCDSMLSLFFLILLAPTFIIIPILIKLDSPGPVFYISRRIGKKGRVFPCCKFRTMVANADQLKSSLAALNERDGILFKITKDPRLTRIGRTLRKFSLDELPQLFNVFLGDMSLVGPRPPLANEVNQYELEHFRRLEVLPGITGLWQVHARNDPSFDRYVALDLAYIENWSFWLDLKILVKTAEVVVRGTGS
jgi:exopolysaccharide biosynthesis polyprenyl glycosylphosphotransferase